MKILLLCDTESASFHGYNLQQQTLDCMQSLGCDVTLIPVDYDQINPCTGCFGCWVKTPGLCVLKNDCANHVADALMNSDAVVLLTRVTYGSYSADMKAILDRMIPNVLPFFKLIQGEMHHAKRYDRYPHWIAFGYGDVTPQESAVFSELVKRNVLNFHCEKSMTILAQNESQVQQAITDLQAFLKQEVRI